MNAYINIAITTLVLLSVACFNCACSGKNKALENALEKAKGNRIELEKVLAHYSQHAGDSLKLKAAEILISNMEGLYYYDGAEIEKYVPALAEIHKDGNKEKQVMDSLKTLYGEFSWDRVELKYDLEEVSSEFLIDNIDMAFKVWREQPWGKQIDFDQFCEYILPYKVDTEKPQYNRREVYEKYSGLLESVKAENGDVVMACKRVNDFLTKQSFVIFFSHNFLPPLSYTILEKGRAGSCLHAVSYTTIIMRALGIPVSLDYTPQWANRSSRHYWNALILPENKIHAFAGTRSQDMIHIHPLQDVSKKGKVYRQMLRRQKDNMELLSFLSNPPAQFASGRLLDVTDFYSDCADADVPVIFSQENKSAYAFTFVFDNRNWVANAWGKMSKDNKVGFQKLEKGIMCLPAFYINEQVFPVNYPFYLTRSGVVHLLVPDGKGSLVLSRKYPVVNVKQRLKRMIGGKFQGADKSDFSDVVDLFEIKDLPSILFQEVNISGKKSFRYLRYLSPPNGFCNIAELEFYGGKENKLLCGEIIGTKGSWGFAKDRVKESAMDGKTETFFDSHEPTGAWVGIDLGKGQARQVASIRFLPANDDNNIRPGDSYELFYWDKEGWISIGKQVAAAYQLIFHNAPQNALFLLHNHTRGKEERIFTYENEQQVWW